MDAPPLDDTPYLLPLRRCDLCGMGDFEPVAYEDRRGKPLTTVVCRRCGLVSHDQIPSDAELAAFYRHEYRRAYKGEIVPSPRRVMRAFKKGDVIHRRLAPFMLPSDRVLEIGAGIGCTVKVFEQAGYDALGIEPSEGFCRYGTRQLQARLRRAYLNNLPDHPAYDVVLLVHVIEHFPSPRQALEQIHSVLRPGGRLYLECPNLGAPHALCRGMFHFAHIYNFTLATLSMMVRQTGFEIVTQFANVDDPNLRLLLVKTDCRDTTIDEESYAQTMTALADRAPAAYRLRISYLRDRLTAAARYTSEFLLANWYVRRRLAKRSEVLVAPSRVVPETPRRRAAA